MLVATTWESVPLNKLSQGHLMDDTKADPQDGVLLSMQQLYNRQTIHNKYNSSLQNQVFSLFCNKLQNQANANTFLHTKAMKTLHA